MKKLALTAGAVLALSVMTAPVALAQDGTASCDAAKTKVSNLEKKLDKAEFEERKDEEAKRDAKRDARDIARGELAALEKVDPGETAPSEEQLREARRKLRDAQDELDKAQEKLKTDNKEVAGLRAQVELAIQERDKACAPATTTPSPTPTPAPENDVDCDEVSGTEAQRILDEDRNDPNNLDQDGDGIACEIDEILADDDNDVVVNNNVAVPSGGIATGAGPRDS